MMKCDDCPLKSDEFDYMESGTKSTVCPYRYEDCHLTEADQRIIEAMLRGEWRCDTCKDAEFCRREGMTNTVCSEWQPKEGGE